MEEACHSPDKVSASINVSYCKGMKENPCLVPKWNAWTVRTMDRLVCPQGRLEEKQEVRVWCLGQDPGQTLRPFPLVSGSVPLGHCYHAEGRLFLGDRGYLCVFLQISSLFKMSAAPCFSKPVNAESSLARRGLDLVYLMVCSGSYRLSHGPDLVFIWLGDRKETPSGVTCDRSSLSHAQGPGRRHIFCRFTELLYLVVSSLSLRASTQRLHNYLQGIARSAYFYHMKNLPRCQLRALQG